MTKKGEKHATLDTDIKKKECFFKDGDASAHQLLFF